MSEMKLQAVLRPKTLKPRKNKSFSQPIPSPLISNSICLKIVRKPLFPMRSQLMRLQYYEPSSVTSGAGTAGTAVWSANGIFDTNVTGTGGQPMGFDTMMLIYDHYTVVRARCTIVARNFSSIYPTQIAISVNSDSTAITSYERLVENGLLTSCSLAPKFSTGYQNQLTIPIDLTSFSGSNDLMDEHDYRGTVAANPVEQTYFHVSCWNPDDTTVVSANFQVLLQYDVIFSEPRTQVIS